MRIAALIEIAMTADGAIPVELIELAYRTSAAAPVVLVMDDGLRDRVDRALDPLVSAFSCRIPGVRYVSADDCATVAHYARQAEQVIIGGALRARLQAHDPALRRDLPVPLPVQHPLRADDVRVAFANVRPGLSARSVA